MCGVCSRQLDTVFSVSEARAPNNISYVEESLNWKRTYFETLNHDREVSKSLKWDSLVFVFKRSNEGYIMNKSIRLTCFIVRETWKKVTSTRIL